MKNQRFSSSWLQNIFCFELLWFVCFNDYEHNVWTTVRKFNVLFAIQMALSSGLNGILKPSNVLLIEVYDHWSSCHKKKCFEIEVINWLKKCAATNLRLFHSNSCFIFRASVWYSFTVLLLCWNRCNTNFKT